MPAVSDRAISIPDKRKPPCGKSQYDPKHDMRAKSDAYQGIIYWTNKNVNDTELTNIMYQIKSAILADRQWRSQF